MATADQRALPVDCCRDWSWTHVFEGLESGLHHAGVLDHAHEQLHQHLVPLFLEPLVCEQGHNQLGEVTSGRLLLEQPEHEVQQHLLRVRIHDQVVQLLPGGLALQDSRHDALEYLGRVVRGERLLQEGHEPLSRGLVLKDLGDHGFAKLRSRPLRGFVSQHTACNFARSLAHLRLKKLRHLSAEREGDEQEHGQGENQGDSHRHWLLRLKRFH